MTHTITTGRFIVYAAATVLVIVVLKTPAVQTVIAGGLVEFASMTERILHFPYWLSDHTRCFSLDRLDPTCPRCL